jgi:DNA-binding NarL/FixJ family response regulator
MKRTILTVDDHELVRLGVRAALASHFGDRFGVDEAPSLEDALAWLRGNAGETLAVLLDLNLGDTRGLAGLQLLRDSYPQLPVIVVSGTRDDRVRDEALVHGARAYICKTGSDSGLPEMLRAIEKIALQPGDGSPPPVPLPGQRPTRATVKQDSRLGKRQVQVLELLLAGQDNEAIVRETGLTLGSVKNCVSSIFLVFNVRSRAELIGLFAS